MRKSLDYVIVDFFELETQYYTWILKLSQQGLVVCERIYLGSIWHLNIVESYMYVKISYHS